MLAPLLPLSAVWLVIRFRGPGSLRSPGHGTLTSRIALSAGKIVLSSRKRVRVDSAVEDSLEKDGSLAIMDRRSQIPVTNRRFAGHEPPVTTAGREKYSYSMSWRSRSNQQLRTPIMTAKLAIVTGKPAVTNSTCIHSAGGDGRISSCERSLRLQVISSGKTGRPASVTGKPAVLT